VVVIGLDERGRIDCAQLGQKLGDKKYAGRLKLASFSAGSNITGIRTNVYEIARICHANGALIFFDFAAVAPYVEIDMNRDDESYFDAVFFSPHKFLGGPGSCGILVFREDLYRSDLPPTTAGGGTVDFVGFSIHDFSKDIETRETAGTPPILQTIRAALAMDLKQKIGVERIESIEARYTRDFLNRLKSIPNIVMVGRVDPEEKIPIISFNIEHESRILHPKFVTKLLNDLFGIQSRAGCSCAGPYGHHLLDIADEQSVKYREAIQKGLMGLKPGWIRINLHYTFSRGDVEFLAGAIEFAARYGHLFLREYVFDMSTGEWTHRDFKDSEVPFGVDQTFETKRTGLDRIEDLRKQYLEEAEAAVRRLEKLEAASYAKDEDGIENLKAFHYCSPGISEK